MCLLVGLHPLSEMRWTKHIFCVHDDRGSSIGRTDRTERTEHTGESPNLYEERQSCFICTCSNGIRRNLKRDSGLRQYCKDVSFHRIVALSRLKTLPGRATGSLSTGLFVSIRAEVLAEARTAEAPPEGGGVIAIPDLPRFAPRSQAAFVVRDKRAHDRANVRLPVDDDQPQGRRRCAWSGIGGSSAR